MDLFAQHSCFTRLAIKLLIFCHNLSVECTRIYLDEGNLSRHVFNVFVRIECFNKIAERNCLLRIYI